MARLTARARAALLILFAGLAIGLMTPPRRLADASTYVLMADSLWRDGDLTYTPADLSRAVALQFADLPSGLFLTKHPWGYAYAKPPLYPLVALPFYAAFGVRGFFALNGVLLAALVVLGADILSHRLDWRHALFGAAVVFGFSVTPAYLHWIDPFLLCSALAAGSVAAYRRGRPGWCGALLAALASCRAPYLALALAPLGLYTLGRHWRALALFAAGALVVGALLLGTTRLATGQWSAYGGERFYYESAFPFQLGHDEPEIGSRAALDLYAVRWPGVAELARSNLYFFLGRFAGVLVYMPTLLVCLLWSRWWDREKLLWLLALLAACEAIQLAVPHSMIGGRHALGNRLFILLPVGLVFVDFLAPCWLRVLATALLLLVAVPVVQAPVYLSLNPGRQMLDVPYRFLPFEWTQAERIAFPFPFPGMAGLTANQYEWERDAGVWTRGGTTAEFVLVRESSDVPRVRLWSLLPAARVADGGFPVALQWQPGAYMDVTLSHPVVTFRDESHEGTELAVYRLTITTDGGTAAAAMGRRDDSRSLGVLVRPLVADH